MEQKTYFRLIVFNEGINCIMINFKSNIPNKNERIHHLWNLLHVDIYCFLPESLIFDELNRTAHRASLIAIHFNILSTPDVNDATFLTCFNYIIHQEVAGGDPTTGSLEDVKDQFL